MCGCQVYKLLYASRLLDCGLASQAFHYCEVIGQAILRQTEPYFVLTEEVIKVFTQASTQTIYLLCRTHVRSASICVSEGLLDCTFLMLSPAVGRQAETL